jgi:hypothetical protein
LAVFRKVGYLELSGELAAGGYRVNLEGNTGEKYAILATTNFVDWTALVTNTTTFGRLTYFDPESTNQPMRFYQAATAE